MVVVSLGPTAVTPNSPPRVDSPTKASAASASEYGAEPATVRADAEVRTAARVAIYGRHSTDILGLTEAQIERCSQFVRDHGLGCIKTVIRDVALSGGDDRRPGLEALRSLIREGAVDIIVVTGLDRLHRNATLLAEFLSNAAASGVQIIAIDDPDNTPDALLKREVR